MDVYKKRHRFPSIGGRLHLLHVAVSPPLAHLFAMIHGMQLSGALFLYAFLFSVQAKPMIH